MGLGLKGLLTWGAVERRSENKRPTHKDAVGGDVML